MITNTTTTQTFLDELLERLGIDPDTLLDAEYSELEDFIEQFADTYWRQDSPSRRDEDYAF